MNPEELREYAASYWRGIDVDKYQPIPHGPARTPEDLERGQKELKIVEELCRRSNAGRDHPSLKSLFMVGKDGALMR